MIKRIEKLPICNSKTINAMRIKALFKAYGTECTDYTGFDFLSFYKNESDTILIALKKSLAIVHCNLETSEEMAELIEFLNVMSEIVICEKPLDFLSSGFKREIGNIYHKKLLPHEKICHNALNPVNAQNITNEIQPAFDMLNMVFPLDFNQDNYKEWYCDTSHCVRHGMTNIYTIKGICSATSYLNEDGFVVVTQLCTAFDKRKMGYAKNLLDYISLKQNATDILLSSQNKESDTFYEHIGFEKIGNWYCYDKTRK